MSPTELRIRQFLQNKQQVGPSTISTLLRLDIWIASIQAGESEIVFPRKLTGSATASDPIQQVAENLIEHEVGIERQLLLKSLQETLFYCVGFDTDPTAAQIKTRLKRFLDRYTKFAFIQRFLSLYFFNYVWFQTGESFRAQASNSQAFEKEMEDVEKVCQKAVVSALKSYESIERRMDRSAATELIREIQRRLRGS